MSKELYCKVFVDGCSSEEELTSLINSLADGVRHSRRIETPLYEVYVNRNPAHGHPDSDDPADAFLYYPFFLDVEPMDTDAERPYVEAVARLITSLRSARCQVVAACEFEDLLPQP